MIWMHAVISSLVLSSALTAAPGYQPPSDYREYFKKPIMPHPVYNKPTPEKAALGRDLFFDPILSVDDSMSCATCHQPEKGWTDGRPRALGRKNAELPRRTPTLLNVGFEEHLLWDGRVRSLEEQALIPITDPREMAQDPTALVTKLKRHKAYAERFHKLFPNEGVSLRTIAATLASFERTIVSNETSFDAFIQGDAGAISPSAKRGLELFNTKGRCVVCHAGWRFSDGQLHDTGVQTSDLGGFNQLKNERFKHTFKTPTLREVAKRGPYMHNGSLKTLADVIEFYDRGGDVRRPSLSPRMRPLGLSSEEKKDLLAFLKTL